jgi:membrane carboxypeptidase/penicillin-binding protein
MKKSVFIALLLLAAVGAQAQTSLVGRVYHHPNILADTMKELTADANKDMKKNVDEAIKKAEEKKGRKLTTEELAELNKKVEEAQKMVMALKDGMKTAVTITFKDEKTMVMKADMKIDDEVMKKAGIPWAKRKLIKAATAIAPAEKSSYERKGDLIIVRDDKEVDTLRLSDDGKYLSGKMDKDTPFRLTLVKQQEKK